MKDESNESGAILQSVLDGLGEIIVFALNRDYRYTAFNENHRREMKAVWNAEIELGTNLLECMADPGLRAKAKASLDRAFRGESFVEVQHQPGVDVYYEIQWRPQRSPAGDTMGVIALIRDITRHQRAENALSESEANFRTVFEGASTGMSLTAPDGRLMRVNQAFADMLGHSIAEMQSLDFAAVTHPDDLAESRECVRSLLADERTTYRMDKRYLHRGGYFVWATVSTMLYRDASGKPVHFITDILDISDRKKAQEALREAHDQLEARVEERTADLIRNKQLLDNTGKLARVGGWEIDLKTGKNYWSETTRIIHEVEPGFDPNLDIAINFYAPESIPIITSLVDRLISLGEPFDVELELITAKKNRIWVRALGQAYRENGKIVRIGGAFQDINERKLAEIELKQYRDHLQELVSERTAELARSNKELELFAYVASHDLQEPLRMVSSYTQLLAQRYEGQLDAKAKKYIDYAVDGSVRMQRLINDLLTYSRVSTRGKESQPADAQAVLGEALRNLHAAIKESGGLVTNDDLPTIRVDASQLLQVFQNLIVNSLKFRGETPPRIHVSAREQGGEWVFSIRDNGIGIDPQFAGRLFVIFRRLHTREEYPGTGIGLAVCKRIVERHGGRIWFESELGRGATFFFTIPNKPAGGA